MFTESSLKPRFGILLTLLFFGFSCGGGDSDLVPTLLPPTPTETPRPLPTPTVTAAPSPTSVPTPDIPATVSAAIARESSNVASATPKVVVETVIVTPLPDPTVDAQATIEAAVSTAVSLTVNELEKIPTATPIVLIVTAIPLPTSTPTPTPVPRPTPDVQATVEAAVSIAISRTLEDIARLPTATPHVVVVTASPVPTPTATPLADKGYSRSRPAEPDALLYLREQSRRSAHEVRIQLSEIIRGDEAWKRLNDANIFNEPPPPGFEYMIIDVRFEHLTGPTEDTQYRIYESLFTLVSSEGRDYDRQYLSAPSPTLDASLYPGASAQGWVAVMVATHDLDPLLTFGREYSGRGGLWWRLVD